MWANHIYSSVLVPSPPYGLEYNQFLGRPTLTLFPPDGCASPGHTGTCRGVGAGLSENPSKKVLRT